MIMTDQRELESWCY